jgi:hypothetical protein
MSVIDSLTSFNTDFPAADSTFSDELNIASFSTDSALDFSNLAYETDFSVGSDFKTAGISDVSFQGFDATSDLDFFNLTNRLVDFDFTKLAGDVPNVQVPVNVVNIDEQLKAPVRIAGDEGGTDDWRYYAQPPEGYAGVKNLGQLEIVNKTDNMIQPGYYMRDASGTEYFIDGAKDLDSAKERARNYIRHDAENDRILQLIPLDGSYLPNPTVANAIDISEQLKDPGSYVIAGEGGDELPYIKPYPITGYVGVQGIGQLGFGSTPTPGYEGISSYHVIDAKGTVYPLYNIHDANTAKDRVRELLNNGGFTYPLPLLPPIPAAP